MDGRNKIIPVNSHHTPFLPLQARAQVVHSITTTESASLTTTKAAAIAAAIAAAAAAAIAAAVAVAVSIAVTIRSTLRLRQ